MTTTTADLNLHPAAGRESLNKARKHAHAVINRNERTESETTPAVPEEGEPQ